MLTYFQNNLEKTSPNIIPKKNQSRQDVKKYDDIRFSNALIRIAYERYYEMRTGVTSITYQDETNYFSYMKTN